MLLSKNVQYGIVGALAIYVVFFTRPAPLVLVNLLSNPLAQLAVLGAVVYVGAKVSLLVALVAAVAVVMTMPGREFMKNAKNGDKTMKPKKTKDITMPSELSTVAAAVSGAAADEPMPSGNKIEAKTETGGSEKFSLHEAAGF
jgi:hypothetical protein